MERILILGVGNILFTDEGIGIKALEGLLQRWDFPQNVRLIDGGTLGMGLMDALMDSDRVYVLDAVLGGGAPGSVYRLTDENLRKSLSFRDSLHQTDLVDTLLCCELLGHRPEGVVYGMEPADYQSMAVGLSPVCTASLPRLCDELVKELRGLGLSISEKDAAADGLS
ncbi:HyaD/HybD family hydrogenase maturation endopeptidase [uncultured Mailhella sp.]|uniref:HyaD/HybD family hydrogenase maturation endopeptidase n=1 Tax=uncultured Mailhella sp. TaxID=1981031 RepID=UPI0026111AB6|nr:HyaD/HybD family hydrogenase maturation endopeptidase [uncultured Mailhella sp.]